MAIDRNKRVQAYANKMRAETEELEALGVTMIGNAFSPILLAKGEPGPVEQGGGALFGGADGKALRAALLKLGYAPEDWMGIDANVSPELFRRAVVTLDPATLVLCDNKSAEVARDAFADDLCTLLDIDDAMLTPGRVVRVAGMRVLNLGGFEAALASDHQKQVVWAYLKQIPPLTDPY